MKVKIEKIVHGGYGLARTEKGVCFIPLSVPGDILDVAFSEDEKLSFGWIKRIISPSIHRRESRCPVFGVCGGCDFDHMEYEYEIEMKINILKEDLFRIAKMEAMEIDGIIRSEAYGYRNHAQFKVSPKGEIGFFSKKSHEVIPLPPGGCALLSGAVNAFIDKIKSEIIFNRGGFRVRTNTRNNVFQKGVPGLNDDTYCYQYVDGLNFRLKIDDFFQVNSFVTEKWVSIIESYLNPKNHDTVADLFCGSGLIALSVAKKVKYVTGVELNRNAVNSARYNARWNDIPNASFIKANSERAAQVIKNANKIVVDPPRSGLSEKLINQITLLDPEAVVYASCDTATFARDVSVFLKYGYYLKKISLVDMFPRTQHTEIVALIDRLS
jgi:23S rRNA (uracil1939-C5)-methyltransferase